MLKTITQIGKSNIQELIDFLNESKDKVDFVSENVGVLRLDNEYGSKFYDPFNSLFNTICLFSENDHVNYVSLIGFFEISMKELVDLYGDYRLHFSSRDELFFYFFNEQSETHPTISVTSSNELFPDSKIKNLQFRWKG